jgi:transposase
MSALTAAQRGDLAEELLPVAANLAVLVHGDGGPEDVREVLENLTAAQKDALLVVLAGLVDPDQPVGKALGWLSFNEHGALTVPSWSDDRSVRDLVPDPAEEVDDEYVDWVAVQKFVRGFPVQVTDAEFLAAVQQCAGMEMSVADVDTLRGWEEKTAERWLNKLRKRYQRSGREFPKLARGRERVFTEAEVVAIRERAAAGVPDLEIAMSFDTLANTIGHICRGRRYPQYGGPIRQSRSAKSLKGSREYMCGHAGNSQAGGYQARNAILTPQERDAIRKRTTDGESVKELAAEYQVSAHTIRNNAA